MRKLATGADNYDVTEVSAEDAYLKKFIEKYSDDIKNYGKEKPDMPGCKERFDLSFILYVATYNIKRRKYIIEILEKYKNKDIMYFRKQKDLNKWVNELKSKSE